jgi:hypothetical protein
MPPQLGYETHTISMRCLAHPNQSCSHFSKKIGAHNDTLFIVKVET